MNELELEEMNRGVIADFRANGGKVGGQHASLDIILLHHMGARSGQARVTPLACVRDGEDMLVVASTGGAPRHPAWYWNLKANPRVTVEAGTENVEVLAGEVADEEHGRLWAMITEAIRSCWSTRSGRRAACQSFALPGGGTIRRRRCGADSRDTIVNSYC